MISKQELLHIKEELSIEQIFELLEELGGEPIKKSEYIIISRTICHNGSHQGSHKLYYYQENHMFKCYTECEDSLFDLYELVKRVKNCNHELIDNDLYNYQTAAQFIINFFNLSVLTDDDFNNEYNNKSLYQDWEILNKYEENQKQQSQQIVEMKIYDDSVLKHLPHPKITIWQTEGIKQEVIQHRGIAYDPKNEGIVIPHYNIENQLVGIRERTLITEAEQSGKYRPAILNGIMYNHPLSFNLYNLNNSKDNIRNIKKALVFEGEKACLQYASYFGEDCDISVAVCGNSLTRYQVQLLLSLGIDELIIAFDKQFQELNDSEHRKWCQKLRDIYHKYGNLVQISFIFDKNELLQYKDSPTDKGPEIFMQLYQNRIFL